MPNRLLKESVKTSAEIDKLTWFEEVVFYRLITTVDDYGCYDGRVIVLKNELFPTKDTVTKKNVEDALVKLERVKLLVRYESDGKPYIYLPTWEDHQRIRNKKRKYPIPPKLTVDCQSNDSQLTADCQSESESNPNPNPNNIYIPGDGNPYRPSIDDVREYIAVKGYHFAAEDFMNYYDSVDWMAKAGVPLRNWMAKCPVFERNWKKDQEKVKGKGKQNAVIPMPEYMKNQTKTADDIDFDSLPFEGDKT